MYQMVPILQAAGFCQLVQKPLPWQRSGKDEWIENFRGYNMLKTQKHISTTLRENDTGKNMFLSPCTLHVKKSETRQLWSHTARTTIFVGGSGKVHGTADEMAFNILKNKENR